MKHLRPFPANLLAPFASNFTRAQALSAIGLMVLFGAPTAEAAGAGKTTAPSPPTSLAAVATSSSQVKLTWKDNSSDETAFKIERAPTSSGSWVQVATVGVNVTSYTDASLSPATSYYYRVRAYNSKNSLYSNIATATTQRPP